MEQQILNYQIERLLGEGGMSRVYLGVDLKTGQKVAIKELLAHLANHDELRDRFRREAQFMAKLSHQHIVRLIRYEEIGTRLFLVQEYIEGITLEEYITKVRGPIPEEEAEKLFCQLLEAFAYAHDNKVIHRDIKPSNILMTKSNQVKVVDFGIAKIAGGSSGTLRTKTGVRMGTVAYMSPEQVNGREIDERTDIYSLGVLLHQMLSGKAPYDMDTESEFEVQVKIVKEPLPRMKSAYEYVSDRMQRIVDKATAKEKEERYRNCNDFLQAIKAPIPPELQPIPKPKPKISVPVNLRAVALAVIVVIFLVVSGVMTRSKHVAPVEAPVEAPAEAPAAPAADAFVEPPAPAAEASVDVPAAAPAEAPAEVPAVDYPVEAPAAPVAHEIGEQYGGGIIFYVDESGQHGLISAKSDIPGQSAGKPEGYFTWDDAKSQCDKLVRNGYSDWFLPNKKKLNHLYLQKSVVGGFVDGAFYWSSSQFSEDMAWNQGFGNGSQEKDDKVLGIRARAVRYF